MPAETRGRSVIIVAGPEASPGKARATMSEFLAAGYGGKVIDTTAEPGASFGGVLEEVVEAAGVRLDLGKSVDLVGAGRQGLVVVSALESLSGAPVTVATVGTDLNFAGEPQGSITQFESEGRRHVRSLLDKGGVLIGPDTVLNMVSDPGANRQQLPQASVLQIAADGIGANPVSKGLLQLGKIVSSQNGSSINMIAAVRAPRSRT